MKRTNILTISFLVSILFTLSACDIQSADAQNPAEDYADYQRQVEIYWEQTRETGRQLEESRRQLEESAAQLDESRSQLEAAKLQGERFDRLLDMWEEQAERTGDLLRMQKELIEEQKSIRGD